jgi:hypothetical protein
MVPSTLSRSDTNPLNTREGLKHVWVFTQTGFYSVVVYDPSKDHGGGAAQTADLLLVRARVRKDLEELRRWIPDLDIREDGNADYRFRSLVGRDDWKRVLAAEVDALSYHNFKNRVAERDDDERHHAYMAVWTAMRKLQP